MSLIDSIILDVVIVVLASLAIWFKLNLNIKTKDKVDKEKKKRESFRNLLVLHSDLILGKHIDSKPIIEWLDKFSEMTINILLWGSDNVVFEYGEYVKHRNIQKVKITEREIHFANAILAFRKELGYKNRFKKISPESIVLIFRIGYNTEV